MLKSQIRAAAASPPDSDAPAIMGRAFGQKSPKLLRRHPLRPQACTKNDQSPCGARELCCSNSSFPHHPPESIVLHPGYLEKSKYNTITVDRNSEDYRELKKSIELNGVKDPVLTRINPEGGGLEIVSGQRRHMIAKELNYPVPAIIQKLDDADVKSWSMMATCTDPIFPPMTSPGPCEARWRA